MKIDESTYFTLRNRMDKDLDFIRLVPFILRNANGQPLANATSVTLNKIRSFFEASMYILGEDKKETKITGIDASVANQIEAQLDRIYEHNDEVLSNYMIEPLKSCLDFYSLMRGWVVGLVLMYKDGKKYCPYIKPVDPRWATWEVGARGLEMFSYRYGLPRVYEEKYHKKFGGSKKLVDFVEVWDKENCYIVPAAEGTNEINADPVDTIPHKIGFCPGVVMARPTQPMMVASGRDLGTDLAYVGESIIAPVRDMIDVMNEHASIWASIDKMQFLAPMVYVGDRETPKEFTVGWGSLIQLIPGEDMRELRTKDVSISSQNLFSRFVDDFEVATLTRVNYGQAGDRQSALAIATLRSDKDKTYTPSRKQLSMFYRRANEMIRRQLAGKCYETEIDDADAMYFEDMSIWKNKFKSVIRFNAISPEENIANIQLANQAKSLGCVPDRTLLTSYLHMDNAEDVLREAQLDRMRQLIPALDMFDAEMFLAKGNATEAEINERKAKIIRDFRMRQLEQGITGEVKNPGSQPNIEIGLPSSQKKSKQMAKEQGITPEAKGYVRGAKGA